MLGRRDRADVNEELKLLWKCKKKYQGWGDVRYGRGWGRGSRDGGWSIGMGLVGSTVGVLFFSTRQG